MSQLITNKQISCIYCGYKPVSGQESSRPIRNSNKILVECKWRCSKCGMLVRRDEKYIEPVKK